VVDVTAAVTAPTTARRNTLIPLGISDVVLHIVAGADPHVMLPREGGGEVITTALPLLVGTADRMLPLEVGDNPTGLQDCGLARGNVVGSDGFSNLIGRRSAIAAGNRDVDHIEQWEVNACRNRPVLRLSFCDGSRDRQRSVVVVGDRPRPSRAIEVAAHHMNGLSGVTRIRAGSADGGWVRGVLVLYRQGLGGHLGTSGDDCPDSESSNE